ncbi:hypothetical protein BDR07DRAFT_1484270 [Suillus spraguei]|nr:hypothetical protein BDR07DRAFT_1484270 [Suillus spraguei]
MRVIEQLNIDGMSGDETDTPPGVLPRLQATYEENMTVPIGNLSLPCILEQKRTAHNSIAIQKLPRNWYDDTWYKANSSSAHAFLGVHKAFNIPQLEPYHSRS